MFTEALIQTLKFEGGYANHPKDPGGETNKGITHTVYDNYRRSHKLAPQSVKLITQEEVNDIYFTGYWAPSKSEVISQTHPKTAAFHFDTAVNCGVGTAAKLLQKALGLRLVDGIIGSGTIAALANFDDELLCSLYAVYRMRYYADISIKNPELQVFLNNWTYRVYLLVRNLYG